MVTDAQEHHAQQVLRHLQGVQHGYAEVSAAGTRGAHQQQRSRRPIWATRASAPVCLSHSQRSRRGYRRRIGRFSGDEPDDRVVGLFRGQENSQMDRRTVNVPRGGDIALPPLRDSPGEWLSHVHPPDPTGRQDYPGRSCRDRSSRARRSQACSRGLLAGGWCDRRWDSCHGASSTSR